jgi:malonyl-CoA O-methyltransferase
MWKRLGRRIFPQQPLKTLSSIDAYQRWAATYPPYAHNPLMQAEEAVMRSLMPDLRGQVVLDLACGTGRYARLAAEDGAGLVIGLDNSMAMLVGRGSEASWKAGLATSESIPLAESSVDVVLCGLALGHLPRLEASIGEIARILKPGGLAMVSDFHPFLYLNGARRTFAAEGKTYAVKHHVHLYADYHRVASEAGLQVEQVLEPGLSEESKMPVVIVFRLRKV